MFAAPVVLLAYLLVAVIAALGWTFFLGNVMFGLGFAANTFFLVKWAHKKWMPGVISMVIVMASIIIVYAWFIGAVAL